ncbi:Major facilitator superfamily domain general substrate transporter [Penicillium sp. IBT 35674x]|nr:Major facilitator superfamily domain general substrate transporter [Penicillium sp. IBT 35674x]
MTSQVRDYDYPGSGTIEDPYTVDWLGNVLVFISMTNYLIDTYSLFAATAAATNAMARALIGFAFPLFTTYMYNNLGTQWASSVPAFLALAFTPLPFIFFRVGSKLRAKSKFANEAKRQLAKLQEVRQNVERRVEDKQAEENTMSSDTEAAVGTERVAATIPNKSRVTAVHYSGSGSNCMHSPSSSSPLGRVESLTLNI